MIFHLAGVVSGEAELDFDKGYRVNLDGSRALLEAIRATGDGYKPRVVFTSSMAVFGAPFPNAIPDDFHLTPLTSYGTQKAIVELMLADYTRRGILEGVGIRLPSIVVRPGKPNKAASGFFSGIIREPLAGDEAHPAGRRDAWCTPTPARARRSAFSSTPRASTAPSSGRASTSTCRACTCTVGEQIEALRRVAGDKVAARIRREPDALIVRIVDGWPHRFDPQRATGARLPRRELVRRDHPHPYRRGPGRQDRAP